RADDDRAGRMAERAGDEEDHVEARVERRGESLPHLCARRGVEVQRAFGGGVLAALAGGRGGGGGVGRRVARGVLGGVARGDDWLPLPVVAVGSNERGAGGGGHGGRARLRRRERGQVLAPDTDAVVVGSGAPLAEPHRQDGERR